MLRESREHYSGKIVAAHDLDIYKQEPGSSALLFRCQMNELSRQEQVWLKAARIIGTTRVAVRRFPLASAAVAKRHRP